MLATIRLDEYFQHVLKINKLDLDVTEKKIRMLLAYKRDHATSGSKALKEKYGISASGISNDLAKVFDLAHKIFQTSHIQPLEVHHVIFTILDLPAVNISSIIDGRIILVPEISDYEVQKMEVTKSKSYEEAEIGIHSINVGRGKIIKKITSQINKDGENIRALSLAMARLAQFELDKLKLELPNSPDSILERDSKIELMTIFINGFTKIALDIDRLKKQKTRDIDQAAQSVVSMSDALSKWWSNKNQKVIDVAIGMPVVAGAAVALKCCGADPIVQNLVVATTAVGIYGKDAVEAAAKVAKSMILPNKSEK